MNKIDVTELETADYDLLENIKAAFYRLWKLKAVVVLSALVGLLASLVYISIVGVHTTYYAGSGVYSAVYGSAQESAQGVQSMNQYASLLRTTRVSERAAKDLAQYGISASQIKAMINSGKIYLSGASSDSKKYGYSLTLVAVADEPDFVVEISNAVAQAFADEINDLIGSSTLQVLNQADNYSTSQSINVKLYMLIFTAGAGILVAVIIFIKEFFSSRVYTIGQCEMDENLIIGLIPGHNK